MHLSFRCILFYDDIQAPLGGLNAKDRSNIQVAVDYFLRRLYAQCEPFSTLITTHSQAKINRNKLINLGSGHPIRF